MVEHNGSSERGGDIMRKTFFSLATACLLVTFGHAATAIAETHDEIAGKPALEADAKNLKATIVTAQLKEPMTRGKNILWCNTFQLAWNELCAYFGEDVRLKDEPPMVPVLNEKLSTKGDIDEASYVAMAGIVKDNIIEKIKKALEEKFKGQASPKLLPDPKSLGPTDIVAYAYLFKNLEFAVPFEDIEGGLNFGESKVSAFGVKEYSGANEEMGRQVLILDYADKNDFVVEIRLESQSRDIGLAFGMDSTAGGATELPGDRLILAKVQAEKTLLETIDGVLKRVADRKPGRMGDHDCLKVPKMNFDLKRSYQEIIGKNLVNRKGAGYLIAEALQSVRFKLDEKGAMLKSEALILAKNGHMPLEMVFDKPFLVIMAKDRRRVPYFALWVDNPELLVPIEAKH
jgi:hypothetical protein